MRLFDEWVSPRTRCRPDVRPLRYSLRARRNEVTAKNTNSDRDGDEPASDVTGPGAKRGVQPAQRKNGKDRASDLMEKLLEDAPKAAETA